MLWWAFAYICKILFARILPALSVCFGMLSPCSHSEESYHSFGRARFEIRLLGARKIYEFSGVQNLMMSAGMTIGEVIRRTE